MSVITHYELRVADSDKSSVNFRDELIKKGVLTMTDANRGRLDFDTACHEEWQKDLDLIKERGVCTVSDPAKNFDDNGVIKDSSVQTYLWRYRDVPEHDSNDKFTRSYSVENGIVTEFLRSRDSSDDLTQHKQLSKEESARLVQEATDYYNSYKQVEDRLWRRDYSSSELESISKAGVVFSDDGNSMSYFRNYDAGDYSPCFYASKALPDTIFEQSSYTESKWNSQFFYKNGECSTPTGKKCDACLDVNDSAVKVQPDSNQVKLFLRLGEEQRKSLVYINKSDVAPSIRNGRSMVCLEAGKNYTAYNLEDKSKSVLPSTELMSEHESAKSAYRNQMDETRKAKQSSSKDAYFHQLDSKVESKGSSYTLPDINVNEDDYPF